MYFISLIGRGAHNIEFPRKAEAFCEGTENFMFISWDALFEVYIWQIVTPTKYRIKYMSRT